MSLDATGMNAANFTTFSLGNGVCSGSHEIKFLFDYPEEYFKMEKFGVLDQLRRSQKLKLCIQWQLV